MEIAAELIFRHAPCHGTPLSQREPAIQTLISRMDKASPLTHQKYTLNSNSSGIKSDANKIDAALKSIKICGNTILEAIRAKREKIFEYEIDF
ncbi:MAG: hypothetical protein ACLUFT_12505 [Gemmiger formicilis]|uniref:hypothetical protein n=1 Tax=Gemmiger formicilis TaxID=745368 RepID=UPI003990EE76